MRNLFRKVFIAGGFEEPKAPGDEPVRRTRITLATFAAAVSIGGNEMMENDEVECLLANMIYKVCFMRIAAFLGNSSIIITRSFHQTPRITLLT